LNAFFHFFFKAVEVISIPRFACHSETLMQSLPLLVQPSHHASSGGSATGQNQTHRPRLALRHRPLVTIVFRISAADDRAMFVSSANCGAVTAPGGGRSVT